MKGKTIIELKDVKSGKVQRVEHGNTFQSAVLSDLFKNYGAYGLSIYNWLSEDTHNFWKKLVGGLLLFDDEIEVGSYYPPAGINMVGNASYNVLNSGVPNEMGSWNESESYVSKDEIVMTYDFTTAQANGSIASVALTSSQGGLIGIGNPSKTRLKRWYMNPVYVNSIVRTFPTGAKQMWDGTYEYMATHTGTKLQVKKVWANSAGIDLIQNYGSVEFCDEYELDLGKYKDLNKGGDNTNGDTYIYHEHTNSTTIEVVVGNVKTKQVNNYTINTPFNIGGHTAVSGSDTTQIAIQYDDNGVRRCSIYDCDNSKWVEDFEMPNTTNWIWGIWTLNGRYYFGTNEDNRPAYSVVNGESLPLNANNVYGFSLAMNKEQHMMIENYHFVMSRPANYLATINNLDDPVVKDNTKTMKVIYVLSRR